MIITYTKPNGRLSIVIAAPKAILEKVLGPLTDEKYRAHVWERSIPADAINPQEMPEGWTPPADRTFRDAWRADGQAISVDMPRARDLQRDRLRLARAERFPELDAAFLSATEDGNMDAQRSIALVKRRLRDAPAHPAIDAAATPDELAAIKLDDLIA